MNILVRLYKIEMAKNSYCKNRETRQRRPSGGQKGKLITAGNKLFLILFYLKNYPTFEVLDFVFEINPSNVCDMVKKLLPALLETKSKLNILPQRKIKNVEKL